MADGITSLMSAEDPFEGLAELKGSPKQCKWASFLRENRIFTLPVRLRPFAASQVFESAVFWIDHRHLDEDQFSELVDELFMKVPEEDRVSKYSPSTLCFLNLKVLKPK